MKIRGLQRENEEIKLNMTAMIDIVFQLLVFFIMTFKVVAMEGDFNVKMPLASDSASMTEELPSVINVRLLAGADGKIARIVASDDLGGEAEFVSETMFADLTKFVENALAGDGDAVEGEEMEVEFDIDFELKYAYTVMGIESVSARVKPDGTLKQLVEKIRFKDNSASIN